VSLEWSTEHVRGEGEEPTEEGGNRGAGPLEAGGRGGLGHFTFLELFYCGLVPFFVREVWPVILHAHGPEIFHTSHRNTFYHSTSFLVPANSCSTVHELPTALRGQLVHLLPVWHLRLGTWSPFPCLYPYGLHWSQYLRIYCGTCNRSCVMYMCHFTFLELFYCGLVLFFAREVWPVILHAHGPKLFHTSHRNILYHSTSFLVSADGHSTPHEFWTAMHERSLGTSGEFRRLLHVRTL